MISDARAEDMYPTPVDQGSRISKASTRPRRGTGLLPIAIDPAVEHPKVRLSDVSLSYKTDTGSRLLALEGINLEVRQGEFPDAKRAFN